MAQARRDKNRRALRRGEGQDAQGRYYYRWMDKVEGKRRKISARTLEELREKEKEIGGEGKRTKEMTLTDCFHKALEIKSTAGALKQGTLLRYQAYWENQVGDFGKRDAGGVTGAQVQEFMAGLVGRGYSRNVIKGVYGVLGLAFRYGISAGLRQNNPMEGRWIAEICRRTEKTVHHRALTEEQEKALLDYFFSCGDHSLEQEYERMIVLFGTGLRFGELSGLTWGDVDFEDRSLWVRRQAIYDKGSDGKKRWRIDTPKSEAGLRKVYLPADVRDCLAVLKKRNEERGLIPVPIDGVGDFCFINSKGNLMDETRFNSLLSRAVKGYNGEHPENPLPHLTAHGARSTNVTRRAEYGTPDRVIKDQVGHKEKDVLMETYAQLVDEKKLRKAAEDGFPFTGHRIRRLKEEDGQGEER